MLEAIAVAMIILWALGMGTAHAFGGLVHVLLVIALIAIAVRVFTARRIV